MRRIRPALAALALAIAPGPALARAAGVNEVFVVGTLYRRHQFTPAFGLDALRCTIEEIRPEVLVLDLTPAEWAARRVAPGKLEYPEVILPYAVASGIPVYPGEPGEPMFSQIVQPLAEAHRTLAAQRPAAADTLKAFVEATFAALRQTWRSPADVQSAHTERVLAGKQALEYRLLGERHAGAPRWWDAHTASVALRAAGEHPGKRVLVLTGIENRRGVSGGLRKRPDVHVVDVESWLGERGARIAACQERQAPTREPCRGPSSRTSAPRPGRKRGASSRSWHVEDPRRRGRRMGLAASFPKTGWTTLSTWLR